MNAPLAPIAPDENVPLPARYSQSLLRRADVCPRSAYLALKYRDRAARSAAMDRGTLVHEFAARLAVELVTRRERSLVGEGEEPGQVASLTAAMIEGIADERPDLVVPRADMEAARICAFHLGVGFDVDPEHVVGIEQKFVLDLGDGRALSGIIDLAAFSDPTTGCIDDYKTALSVSSATAYAEAFQPRVYALLLAEGRPVVAEERCAACAGAGCEACGRLGRVETLGDRIGGSLQHFRTREIYPRVALRPDGSLMQRVNWLVRPELAEIKSDLLRIIGRIERGVSTGDWPAVSGKSHCAECPAESECPIPRHLRRFAGAIQTAGEAGEALEWAARTSERVNATRAEVREFAKAHGEPVTAGLDVYDFEVSHGREIVKRGGRAAWDELQVAVERAAAYGEAFDVNEFLRFTTKTAFKKVATTTGDGDGDRSVAGAPTSGGGDARSADERWGADVPY